MEDIPLTNLVQKYTGEGDMNIADELVVAILYRPRLRVEDAIGKLGSLVSMGMMGKGTIQTF